MPPGACRNARPLSTGFSLPVSPIIAIRGDRNNNEVTQEQYRGVIGVRGDLPFIGSTWSFEVAGTYSRSVGVSTRNGIREDRLARIVADGLHDGVVIDALGHALDRAQPVDGVAQPIAIDLDPAAAQQPQAVLLDEPTASLDFGNQGLVMRAIRTLADQGLAVLFTTHDPNQALRCADRALLMRDGRVLHSGAVAQVIEGSRLRELYHAGVHEVADAAGGAPVFLPAFDASTAATTTAAPSD